ncbi:MAG: hypothetical protein MJZ23_06080 [Paludibacteraceae bacterium]|nr:hypothetical protein [Paludibacteraceae bacterium]
MWSDYIINNREIKKYYGDRDPILKGAACYSIELDCQTRNVRLGFEFFDWPKPLPKDWKIDEWACVEMELELENVHFNTVNANHNFVPCSVNIDASNATISLQVYGENNNCILDLNAQKATVINFGYYNHYWD